MPVQRISKPFKDISASFKSNPLNSDLIGLKNANAIARSIRNLILTEPGEKPFQPDLGSEVYTSLFETLDQITASNIKQQIENTVLKYEPRVELGSVIVDANTFKNAFDVQINYEIIGVDMNIISKSGSWYAYGDTKLGQGRDAVKEILKDNPELFEELENKIVEQLNN